MLPRKYTPTGTLCIYQCGGCWQPDTWYCQAELLMKQLSIIRGFSDITFFNKTLLSFPLMALSISFAQMESS